MTPNQIAQAIDLAVSKGAGVINISLGTSIDSLYLKNSVSHTLSENIVIVAAAGNDSK